MVLDITESTYKNNEFLQKFCIPNKIKKECIHICVLFIQNIKNT